MPGSVRVGHATDRDDGLVEVEVSYHSAASLDDVRGHYRAALREHGWRIGEVETSGEGWEFDASRGAREVELELEQTTTGTRIEVSISEPASG